MLMRVSVSERDREERGGWRTISNGNFVTSVLHLGK